MKGVEIYANLHLHSTHSDGVYTPAELVKDAGGFYSSCPAGMDIRYYRKYVEPCSVGVEERFFRELKEKNLTEKERELSQTDLILFFDIILIPKYNLQKLYKALRVL